MMIKIERAIVELFRYIMARTRYIFLTKYCCAVVLFRLLKVKHKIVVTVLIISAV